MQRRASMLLLALLIAGTMTALLPAPLATAATITNRPTIYRDNVTADPLDIQAGSYVNITFTGMTISGAQIWLWWSTDGSALIVSGDEYYAGPFLVSQVLGAGVTYVTLPAANVQLGVSRNFVIGNSWINGSIPEQTAGGLHWVKVTDVSPTMGTSIPSSDVGVSTNRINVLPKIKLTPTSGPAGVDVKVEGFAFTDNDVANVSVGIGNWPHSPRFVSTNVSTGGIGEFTKYFSELGGGVAKGAPDEGKRTGTATAGGSWSVNVTGYDWDSGNLAFAIYTEKGRQFNRIRSFYTTTGGEKDDTWDRRLSDGSTPVTALGSHGSGNGTDALYTATGSLTLEPYVKVEVKGKVSVNGSYFNVWDGLQVWWDYNETTRTQILPPALTIISIWPDQFDDNGDFVLEFLVPIAPRGTHLVGIVDDTWSWNFTVYVQKTLIAIPDQVFIGDIVLIEGYGFDANKNVTVWWWDYNYGTANLGIGTQYVGFKFGTTRFYDGDYMRIATSNTGSGGTFTVSFTVPRGHGGDHAIVANETTPASADYGITGVTIKPRVILINGTDYMALSEAPDYQSIFTAVMEEDENGPELDYGYFSFKASDFLPDDGSATVKPGTLLFVWAQGLPVIDEGDEGDTHEFKGRDVRYNRWTFAYDNGFDFGVGLTGYWGEAIKANGTGDIIMAFIAVGDPGVHVISLYSKPGWPSTLYDSPFRGQQQVPMDWVLFNIAGPAPDTVKLQEDIEAAKTELKTDISRVRSDIAALSAQLSSAVSDIRASITSAVSDIRAAITASQSAIQASISDLATDIAGVKSDVAGVLTAVTGVAGDVAGVKSDVAGVRSDVAGVKSDVAGLRSDIAGVKSDVASVKSDVASVKSSVDSVMSDLGDAVSDLSDVSDNLGNVSTYVLIVLAIAVITLVVGLASLLRKRP